MLTMETVIKIKEPKECCSARKVLWYLVFAGFAVNYMIRLNLNIILVSMVKPKPKDNISLTSECIPLDIISNTQLEMGHMTNNSFLDTTITNLTVNLNSAPKLVQGQFFEWNEREQGFILASFFWLHWITQIPGGILAAKYGTKFIFGWSNFVGVAINFVIPWFAHKGSPYLILIRTFQGFCCGFAWPSMHKMVSQWIPPNERSKFVTAFMGSAFGTAVTYPLCGFVIEKWGWEAAFYFCGVLGTIWFSIWWILVYDNPANHPRISQDEKDYISNSIGNSLSKTTVPTPWRAIWTDITVWASILSQVGNTWGLFTLMVNGPIYFKFIHGWDIRSTGLLSGLPHVFRISFSYVFSVFGDYLLKSEKMSRTNVRKLATIMCNFVQGICLLALAYSGCDKMTAIIMLTLAVAASGAVSTGALSGLVDLSPNHSAVLLGIVNSAVALVGFCTPSVVGYFTFHNQTTIQWQKVFWICSGVLFASCIFYVLFAKAEVAPWNSPEEKIVSETEMMLKRDSEKKTDKKKTEIQSIMYSNEVVY